jgi:LytS/YehU family sensor histidine kinase
MNPHFLFNALNSINSFIVKNEVHKASDYLSKFSKLMRMILEHSKKKSVLLSDEIEALELYLKIESNRFEKSFEHSILIEEGISTNEIYIPPLIIQPFVENAIWHGIQHQSNVGLVHIKFSKQGDDFVKIEIVDNGIGREKAKKLKSKSGGGNKSYGINITKERIKYSHPNNSMEIVDLHDQEGNPTGTKVILILHNEEIINNESSDNR